VAEAWRRSWKGLAPKTRGGYESILRHHLLPQFGPRPVAEITPEVVEHYIGQLQDRGLAPGTVHSIYRALHTALATAVRFRMLAVNPCAGVKLPPLERQEMHFLTAPEVDVLAAAHPEHWHPLIFTAVYTGLRAGELYGLRRRDVELDKARLHVRQALKEINSSHLPPEQKGFQFGPPKTPASRRTVALPAFLVTMLRKAPGSGPQRSGA